MINIFRVIFSILAVFLAFKDIINKEDKYKKIVIILGILILLLSTRIQIIWA